MDSLELKVPPVVLVLIHALAMWLIREAVPGASVSIPWETWLISGYAAAGALFALLGVVAFRRAKTTVDPRTPQDASSLVTGGIYRLTRNPMYVGFLFLLISWAVLLGNIATFVAVPLFVLYMNKFQIIPEERQMHKLFAADYTAYKSRVRRWL